MRSRGEERHGGARRLGSDALCRQSCPDCTWSSSPSQPFNKTFDRVLLYNYAKVGSTTLSRSLEPYTGRRVVFVTDAEPKHLAKHRLVKTHEVWSAQQYLAGVPKGERVWIVTGTRDPFTWSVSRFFQSFKVRDFKWMTDKDLKTYTMQEIKDHFHDELSELVRFRERWFHDSFQKVIQFDLSACSGKLEDGSLYAERTLNGVHLSILLLRLDDSAQWATVLPRFMPGYHLGRPKNVVSEKYLADLVTQFRREWTWAEEDVRRLLQDDTWDFYSEAERDATVRALPRS